MGKYFNVKMIKCWNFYFFRNPTPDPVGVGDGESIMWPVFTSSNRTYAYLAYDADVRQNYRQKNYAFWSDYYPYITQGSEL